MSKSQLLLTIFLGVVCLGVIGFCIWSVMHGGPTELVLGAAVVTLGLAQLVSFTARDSTMTTALRRVSEVMGAYNALAREVHSVSRRLEVLESGGLARLPGHHPSHQRAELAPPAASSAIAAPPAPSAIAAPPVRRTIGTTVPPSPAVATDRPHPAPVTNSGHYQAPSAGSGPLEEERFDLYLEPIVQIDDGSTRHYRASLSLRMADGTRVGMDSIRHQATRAGLMPMLDILTVTRAMAVLRRLMQRQRGVSIFCGASTAALSDGDFIARLNRLIVDNEDLARALVIDLGQPALGSLSQPGQNSLAKLTEHGVAFCLSDADGQSGQAITLRELGFRFVAMDIMTLADSSSKQADETVAAFVRDASLHSLKIIASNVATRTELAAVTARAVLGFGPLFSPPRLVRHDITGQAASAAA